MTDLTLQEEVAAAYAESSKTDDAPSKSVDALEPKEKTRAPDGKFVAKDEDDGTKVREPVKAKEEPKEPVKEESKEPVAGKVDEPAKEEPKDERILTQDKPPIGWTPKMRERWGEIDPEIRGEILRREEASVAGVRQLQAEFAPQQEFVKNLMPFIQEAAQNNLNPTQYISNVLNAERNLRQGNDEQRFAALCDIAEGYNIPLRRIINEAMGREVVPARQAAPQLPPEVQRELEEARQFRQQFQAQQQQAPQDPPEFVEFAKTHKYFDDVREQMAIVMEQGGAKTLEEAYDQALWINPGTREIMLEEARKPGALADKQKAALGVKVKTSNSAETRNDAEHDDDDDTYATVRKAMMANTGRV